LVTTTQASAVKQEREKPEHTYSDKDTLWGLYKLLMYGIENMDITRWQGNQQKLHHLIMAEYAIATEPHTLSDVNFDILDNGLSNPVIGPGITPMGPRVVVEEDKDGNPLVSAQPIMIDYSKDGEDDGVNQAEFEAHIESDEEYAERVAIIEGEKEEDPFITDEEEDEVMDAMLTPIPAHHEPLIPTQEELDAEHVGPPEMYTGTEESSDLLSQVESSVEETLDTTDLFGGTTEEEVVEVDEDNLVEDPVKLAEELTGVSTEVEETQEDEGIDKVGFEEEVSKEVVEELAEEPIDFAALANKYSNEELNEPVPIIPPAKINLPEKEEEVVRSQRPVTVEEAFKEETEEDFLNIEEHEGLTVPEGMITNAAIVEKKMILLYGSVRPYGLEECGDQLNVTIDDTYESFCIKK